MLALLPFTNFDLIGSWRRRAQRLARQILAIPSSSNITGRLHHRHHPSGLPFPFPMRSRRLFVIGLSGEQPPHVAAPLHSRVSATRDASIWAVRDPPRLERHEP